LHGDGIVARGRAEPGEKLMSLLDFFHVGFNA
jgi:hypothetical protein